MIYTPEHQYRCVIIRGKSQSEMEDLLPMYANMVHNFCPCTADEFDARCNKYLAKVLYNNESFDSLPEANRKTVRNHLTEVAGKLLALYYETADGLVLESELCSIIRENNDFPLFFKNLCLNFQFPNGTNKVTEVQNRISKDIHIKPFCYVVALLYYAQLQEHKTLLTKQEIGYYVLNNLDVLQGKVTADVVYKRIIADRNNKIHRPQLSGSHDWQHIKEQFNLLELSNIVVTDNTYIWLNKNESKAISIFLNALDTPFFDVDSYNLNTAEGKKEFYADWGKYYGTANAQLCTLQTSFNADVVEIADKDEQSAQRGAVGLSTVDLGDKGEALVYKLECERVKRYRERLVNKVLLLGKTKGLGYDISSIEADENPLKPEFARYIEVKATTRVTEPSFDSIWIDSLNITSKEWVAAEQYGDYYNIYRVYFTKKKTIIIRIQNPYKKYQEGSLEVYPTIYQMNFGSNVIEKRYASEEA